MLVKITVWTDHVLNAMAIYDPLDYAPPRYTEGLLYLNNKIQIFIDFEDNLDTSFISSSFLKH